MKKGAEECLEGTKGTHQAGTPPGGLTSLGARLAMVWATPGPPLTLSPATFFSLPSKLQFIAQNRVFAVLALDFFDLLAQPIFVAEILSTCSLVCDSSPCPSRFVFSGLYVEYFAAVGDRL